MFLKRIAVHGFKSFADRTEFDFGSGVTGIVGPNGCGKSNVVDAVRWVLGEQSARSLRGAKMLDVIFSGSRSRPPANSADVTLTFDNSTRFLDCDTPEVQVARTLYRSGESEYRLNGEVCRLKDIRNLLLDTGVAVHAYSVIEQGRVDVLLQANPIQRREIFEEAAGISRYRSRRADAQRKLERTQNNVLRLNDILEELERQLRSVKLAAGKARNFQEYDARLRELRSEFSLTEYHQLEQAWERARAEIGALEAQVQSSRQESAQRDAQAAELGKQLEAFDERLRRDEATHVELQNEASTLAERRAQGARRLSELGETRARRAQQVVEITARADELRRRIAEEERAVRQLDEAAEQFAGRAGALEQQRTDAAARCEESRASLEQERSAAFEVIRRASLLHNQQTNLEQQSERVAREIDARRERAAELRDGQREQDQRRDAMRREASELDDRINALTGAVREADARLARLRGEHARIDAAIAEAKEARAATLSRLSVLEDMEQRLEGVDRGTRSILEWRQREGDSGGVIGLVADVLRIDDPRLGVLQPLLSAFENRVVVRDAEEFLDTIARRGATNGSARIIALDRLRPAVPEHAFDGLAGVVARAADWVLCDDQYRGLAEALLGHVFVVDSLHDALRLSGDAPEDYAFATLDGYAVTATGQITIGAAQATTGLISRKAEIRQLRAQLDEDETRLERATRARLELDEALSDAQVQREATLGRVAVAQKQHAEQQAALARVDDELARVDRERSAMAGELKSLRAQLQEKTDELAGLHAEREAVDAARRAHESQIGALERELGELERALRAFSQQLTEARVDVGRSAERRTAGEAALAELRERLAALLRERETAQNEEAEAARAIDAANGDLANAERREAVVLHELRECRAAIEELGAERNALRQRIEECGAAARAIHAVIEQREAQMHERQIAAREAEVRKENLVARVADELSLDLAALYTDYRHEERDWDAIREEIETLRQKIQRLGNVNLDALRELDELTPRHENMRSQRQDLLDAIEQLESLIVELDEESRKRFLASFENIREHFQGLFRKLFGGGKADIILEDADNPLECGIEIIARPPGKEPQSISLLSGGEKTMTAVALLLAVFKSRPSPFAILDEVDAALDEANVGRFNDCLQEFLAHSQFVVITHNKRTMQQADVLYGVTMEETGVSKRVSVRFDDRVDAPSLA